MTEVIIIFNIYLPSATYNHMILKSISTAIKNSLLTLYIICRYGIKYDFG
jgi:hypothetical protein